MLIQTEILPDADSVFDMEVKFDETNILIQGRIAHVKQISEEPGKLVAHLGIEYVDLPLETRASLEKLISDELENG
jgi:hypothetical protein